MTEEYIKTVARLIVDSKKKNQEPMIEEALKKAFANGYTEGYDAAVSDSQDGMFG